MASLSTCHLGLWLGWQILLNLVKSMCCVCCSVLCLVQCVVYVAVCCVWCNVLCMLQCVVFGAMCMTSVSDRGQSSGDVWSALQYGG